MTPPKESCTAVLSTGSAHVPDTVTTIGDSAFYECRGMTSIKIPDSVTSIESIAFYYCDGLTSITLPDSVTSIKDRTFDGCTNLTDVYYTGTEEDKNQIDISQGNNPLLKATWHCSGVPREKHNLVKHPAAATTCASPGNTEYYSCRDCDKYFSDEKGKQEIEASSWVIPATGHKWSSWETVAAATALKAGSKQQICSVCGEKQTAAIDKLKPTVKLSAARKTIKAKKSFTLTISKLAKGDRVKTVKSSKAKIATVKKTKTNKYKITGKKKGKAVITVTLKSGKMVKCTVTVT